MTSAAARAAALALALTVTASAPGCGGRQASPRRPLSWNGAPEVFRVRTLPYDRVLIGAVRNTSRHTLHLAAAALVVHDANGRALRSSAAFRIGYAHGLFGAFQQPSQLPREELLRLGKLVDLPPGRSAPFYASWRLTLTSKTPVRIDYPGGTLAVPSQTRDTAR